MVSGMTPTEWRQKMLVFAVKVLISLLIGLVVMSWVMMGPLDGYLTQREIDEIRNSKEA
jgi:hypothetical protein